MFTGLIEGIGKIRSLTRMGEDMSMTITPPTGMSDYRIGESIAVNGVCLTVTDIQDGAFSVDVSGETLSRTTLAHLVAADEVNLERAVRLSDRLGGHLVAGHVDGIGRVLQKEQRRRFWFFRIGVDPGVSRYCIEKGSIAVDGISLTINRCQDTFFEVNIIPETGRETTILKRKVGDLVNIETDMIGKYVERFFLKEKASQEETGSSLIDEDMLKKFGFGD